MNKEIMGPSVSKGGDEPRARLLERGRVLISLGPEGSSAPLAGDNLGMPNPTVPHAYVWRRSQ